MKRFVTITLLALVAVALGACSTVDSRIKEKQNVFNSLTPVEQANIKQGVIDVGYSTDMVYMAMGKPDSVKESTNAKGRVTTWVYNAYYQDYVGSHMVGYRRQMYYDSRAKVWRVYYTPVREDVYRDRVEEVGRVTFRDGKVESVEQVKDE